MAFGQLTITNKGTALIAKCVAGAAMQFTRMAVGDGQIGSTDPKTLNALVHRILWVTLNGVVRSGSEVIASGTFNNQGVSTAFYYREIGLFAQDPQEGEILYMYGNAGTTADQIPAQGTEIVERVVYMTSVLSSSITLTVQLESGAYALASQITAANMLNLIKQVDGSGSGLDADLLRGLSTKSDGEADTHMLATKSDGSIKVTKLQIGTSTVVPGIYIQSTDPGAVPANSLWFKPKTS
jgi:hypothetical protein